MSHFTVMVIGDTPEEDLEPFNENLESEFNDISDEYMKQYQEDTVDKVVLADGTQEYTWSNKFKNPQYKMLGDNEGIERYIYPEDSKIVTFKMTEIYDTFDEYMTDFCGYTRNEDGQYGYWHNPVAKWDWYSLGGRWSGMLRLKPEAKSGEMGRKSWTNADKEDNPMQVDSALLKDIDFTGMELQNRIEAEERWERFQKELEEGKREEGMLRFLYGITEGTTKEKYIENNISFSTFAVLKDKRWYEKGEMLYWACVANEKSPEDWDAQFKALLGSLDPNTRISIFDCHI